MRVMLVQTWCPQDVTMRLIAERLLPSVAGAVYIDKELTTMQLKPLPLPKDGHAYHIFCSEHNPGAEAVLSSCRWRARQAACTASAVKSGILC